MSGVVVACCKVALAVGEVRANRAACRAVVIGAAQRGARIVVLPEFANNSGYVSTTPRRSRSWPSRWTARLSPSGVRWRGNSTSSSLAACAHGTRRMTRCTKCRDRRRGRSARRLPQGAPVGPGAGDVRPGRPCTAGARHGHGRISVMVCYGLEVPEWVRLPALDGAELLCAPTNWPREPWPDGESPRRGDPGSGGRVGQSDLYCCLRPSRGQSAASTG